MLQIILKNVWCPVHKIYLRPNNSMELLLEGLHIRNSSLLRHNNLILLV